MTILHSIFHIPYSIDALGLNPRNSLQCLPRSILRLCRSTKRRIKPIAKLLKLLALIGSLMTISVTLGTPLFRGRSLSHKVQPQYKSAAPK